MTGYEKSPAYGGGKPYGWRTWISLLVIVFAVGVAAWPLAG